jgi:hypothetical protein
MRKILLATVAAVPLLAVGMMPASSQDLKQKGKEDISQSQGRAGAQEKRGPAVGKQIQGKAESIQDKAQPKTEGRAESETNKQDEAKQADQAKSGKKDQAQSQSVGQSAKDKTRQGAQGAKSQLSQDQNKAKQSTAKKPNGAENEPARTSGQATRPNEEPGRQQQSNENQHPQNNAAQKNNAQPGNAQQNVQGENRTGGAEGRVTLNEEQRTKIQRTVLSGRDVPRDDRVNFNVAVGVDVPREVRIAEVPETLIEIHPEWRGHEYFVVRDEIVIVDHDRHVVALVPVGSSSASTGSSTTTVTSFESPDQIRRVQEVLVEKGFYHGRPDGRMGPETRDALIKFQEREGIETHGRLDERTFGALGISVGRTEGQGQQGQAEPKAGQSSTSGQASSPSSSEPRNSQNKSDKTEQSKRPSTSGEAGKPQDQNERQSTSGQAGKQPAANADENKAGSKTENKAGQPGGTEGRSINRQNQPAATGKSQENQRKRD